MSTTGNEIDLYSRLQDPLQAVSEMGQFFYGSGMFGCQKLEQGKVLALACLFERKSPFDIKRNFHLINGQLCMRADAMLAEFRKRGGKHREISRTDTVAEIELSFEGQTNRYRFTWEDAEKEPFIWTTKKQTVNGREVDQKVHRTQWATPRARMQMLWNRVASDGVRAMAPEIVAGVQEPSEVDPNDAGVQTINLQPAPTASTPEPARVVKADVIDSRPGYPEVVSTIVVSDPAPAVDPAPAPKPAAAAPAPKASISSPAPTPAGTDSERATVDQLRQLEALVGSYQDLAVAWLVKNGWLKANESIACLPRKRVLRILSQQDSWLVAIGAVPSNTTPTKAA